MSRVSKTYIEHSLGVRMLSSDETEEFSLRLAYIKNLPQQDERYEVKRLNLTMPKDK